VQNVEQEQKRPLTFLLFYASQSRLAHMGTLAMQASMYRPGVERNKEYQENDRK